MHSDYTCNPIVYLIATFHAITILLVIDGCVSMTLLVGWLAVDQRSAASAYILSDSRYTWSSAISYDYGRKVFACKNSPDIMAYCGDVLFPSTAIARMVAIIEQGLLFGNESTSEHRSHAIFNHLSQLSSSYPSMKAVGGIDIYHISRDLDGSFHTFYYHTQNNHDWMRDEIDNHTDKSKVIFIVGAGANDFKNSYSIYNADNSPNANTSRNIFHCFCDCLLNNRLSNCGGAPQLVGLYRVAKSAPKYISNGIEIGIIVNHNRCFLGAELEYLDDYDIIRWYNELFEICDGNSMLRKITAMRQPNPLSYSATP